MVELSGLVESIAWRRMNLIFKYSQDSVFASGPILEITNDH